MSLIYVPAKTPEDWRRLLADPAKHWKVGFSARALAYCWHAAQGLPPEIVDLFDTATAEALQTIQPLLILPERVTPVAGKGKAPQSDVFVLGKATDRQLVSVTVEGKVNEPFGTQNQTVAAWKVAGNSDGSVENRRERLTDLLRHLSLTETQADPVAYQLVQRTAAAVIEAKQFNAPYAVMIVQSFSPTQAHIEPFYTFVNAFGQKARPGQLIEVTQVDGIRLFVGWAQGDSRYLSM